MENGQGPGPGNPGISSKILSEVPYLACEKCNSEYFTERMMIKKISKILTGSAQDSIVPIPVVCCAECGHVNEMFKPKV